MAVLDKSNAKERKIMTNNIEVINTSYHKKMTDRHLAQVNFVATMSQELWQKYIEKTSIDHQNLGRIRFMEICDSFTQPQSMIDGEQYQNGVRVFGRVSHGYGYDISQDIVNAIQYSKGIK